MENCYYFLINKKSLIPFKEMGNDKAIYVLGGSVKKNNNGKVVRGEIQKYVTTIYESYNEAVNVKNTQDGEFEIIEHKTQLNYFN